MREMILVIGFALLVFAPDAYAYIGPGLGAGAIALILGVIGSIFLGLFAVLYYPLKRMRQNRKKPAGGNK